MLVTLQAVLREIYIYIYIQFAFFQETARKYTTNQHFGYKSIYQSAIFGYQISQFNGQHNKIQNSQQQNNNCTSNLKCLETIHPKMYRLQNKHILYDCCLYALRDTKNLNPRRTERQGYLKVAQFVLELPRHLSSKRLTLCQM